MKRLFIIILLVFTAVGVFAQHISFRHYQVEQGLSNNSVTCSIQDNKGFMWFGTKDGLNRFDGYSFKSFYTIPGDSTSIGTNFIESLYEDEKGIIWVGTEKGLYQYNKITETFRPVRNDVVSGDIIDIQSDGKGSLWIINIPELLRYDMRTGAVVNYSSRYHFEPTSISVDSGGHVFVAAVDNKIREFQASADSFRVYTLPAGALRAQPTHELNTIYCAEDHTILVGTMHHGLKLFDYARAQCTDLISNDKDNPEIFVRNVLKVSSGKIWIASESGIFIYDKSSGVVNFKKQYNDPYSISDNAVYCLCRDREGGIWAGTYFGGVNYFANSLIEFEKFFPGMGSNSLSGNAVREICRDSYNNLWVGTEDAGLNKIDGRDGRFSHFLPGKQKGNIAYYNIHAVLPDGDRLYIGSFLHGLDVMDIPSGKVVRHYSLASGRHGLSNDFIYSLSKTRAGVILAGTSAGLYSFNERKDSFEVAGWVPPWSFVTAILEDTRGGIWAGTFREGAFYRSPSGKTVNFGKSEGAMGLTSNRINGIFEDSKGLLWITTENGLCCYDPVSARMKKYTISNGLPGNVTYKTLEDGSGNIWVSTSKGLLSINGQSGAMRVYTKANGLLSDQFNYSSAYKDPSGDLYFGSVKGMIRFNPGSIRKNAFNPPVLLTGFQVNNGELPIDAVGSPLSTSITYAKRIELSHTQSSISIDFSAISFTAPEMTQYAYKMEGLENDWTYLKSNRKIYFTNLPPGDYRLLVKAMNGNGNWTTQPEALTIVIQPPFWRSAVAYFLYFLLLVLAVWYIIRSYHRRTQLRNQRRMEMLENEKAKEIYHAKIEFFTNVAHEIRTPLTLIKLPLEKIISLPHLTGEVKRNLGIMEKNTDRLIDLTNQLLDFRKIENNTLSLSYVKTDVSELVEDIYTSFKPAAEQRNIQFRLEMPRMHFQAYIDAEAVRKVLSNLLSNAIKYGDREVKIKILPFSSEDEYFSIRVTNDGRVIPKDMREKIFEPFFRLKESQKESGTGIGLALALSLAQLHKGTLSVDADDMQNSFTLTLPIHQETEFELYQEEAAVAPAEVGVDDNRNVILLVEDNKDILDFIAGELKSEYSVMKAHNGAEALNKIGVENIQLIISDVMMPVMDGYSLCKEVKSNVEYSHIPVILLTAKNSLQSKIEGLEMGADAYIEKPFSQQYLLAQIKSLLNNRSKIKEHFANSPLVNIKTMAYSRADERFLTAISEIIQNNLASSELNVDLLAREMNMSRPTLYRKIKGLSNLAPNDLIKVTRLKKAAELLAGKEYKIYEVAGMVGYSLAANFSRDFMKQFGISPTEYTGERIG